MAPNNYNIAKLLACEIKRCIMCTFCSSETTTCPIYAQKIHIYHSSPNWINTICCLLFNRCCRLWPDIFRNCRNSRRTKQVTGPTNISIWMNLRVLQRKKLIKSVMFEYTHPAEEYVNRNSTFRLIRKPYSGRIKIANFKQLTTK